MAQNTLELNIIEDTYTDSIRFYQDHSKFSKLLIGFGSTSQNGTGTAFLKYDISPLVNIEEEWEVEMIEKVELMMYQYRNRYMLPLEVVVTQPLEDWNAGAVSWINQPDIDPAFTSTQTIEPVLGWSSLNITEIFFNQIANWENSFGLAVKTISEDSPAGDFWSIDCLISDQIPNCTQPLFPYILVTFKETTEDGDEIEVPEDNTEEKDPEEERYIEEEVDTQETSNVEEIIKVKVDITETPTKAKEVVETVPDEIQEDPIFIPEVFGEIGRSEDNNTGIGGTNGVLGISDSKEDVGYCRYKYNLTLETLVRERCRMKNPVVSRIEHPLAERIYWIDVDITVPQSMDMYVQIVKCKKGELFDPQTWFGKCAEEKVEEYSERVNGEIQILNASSGIQIDIFRTDLGGGRYKISIPVNEDMSAKYFRARYIFQYDAVVPKDGKTFMFSEVSPLSDKVKIPQLKLVSNADLKPLSFPFNKVIGVTQWYGKTAYQNPHTGIDFGAKKEPVLATNDGRVIYAGWDHGKNKCLSGGNYLLIQHKDNLHSLYLHLDSFTDSSGIKLKVGDKVYKGQQIGISGNSGLYNCEALGYHLHFEVRKSSEYGSHTNPVPLVNVEWNKVHTLGFTTHPGRLSGENPHPGK